MRNGRRAPGVDRLYVPGELEAEFEAHRMRDGIPLNDATLADLAAAAHRILNLRQTMRLLGPVNVLS